MPLHGHTATCLLKLIRLKPVATLLLLPSWVAVFTKRFEFLGMLGLVVQTWVVFFVMWYLCYWLYQRKILFKV